MPVVHTTQSCGDTASCELWQLHKSLQAPLWLAQVRSQRRKVKDTATPPAGSSDFPRHASHPISQQGTVSCTCLPVAHSPKCVDISSFGEGQLVLIPPGHHFSHNLRGQVAQPVVGQLQLVLTPGGQDKDTGPSVGGSWPGGIHLHPLTCGTLRD